MPSAVQRKTDPFALPSLDRNALENALDANGYATTPALLTPAQCRGLCELYSREELFRSRIVMARHSFGQGEYQYFRYPLPAIIRELRQSIYPMLVPTANRWRAKLGEGDPFPSSLDAYLRRCHAAGQARPTPLMLKYGPGDYNCLHQDLYGELVFPLQMTILLSEPGAEFTGGEFVLVEQRPRMQSKAEVVPLRQGEAVIFAVHHRPVAGKRGTYRVNLRHGVSRVHSGERFTLGIIFHDAA